MWKSSPADKVRRLFLMSHTRLFLSLSDMAAAPLRHSRWASQVTLAQALLQLTAPRLKVKMFRTTRTLPIAGLAG
ncbi:hypothetical protein L3Q82_016610 [Scortum barcoo]|uniref:Uncharacterized protein n=1 Tax=Scortum barcoo TaxID=214431 RepID=A0ACB8X800_9TELE|nr:hypothetical protein L3Q82_016610 [Scortum barcoo]